MIFYFLIGSLFGAILGIAIAALMNIAAEDEKREGKDGDNMQQ